VHEVRVYDQNKAPGNFSEGIVPAQSNKLLWVSDLHFSKENHAFPRDTKDSLYSLSEAIRRDIKESQPDLEDQKIGGMLISGDFTWRVTRDEFDWAAKFIGDVREWSRLTPNEILICPGNHDFSFSAEPWTLGTVAANVEPASSAEYKKFYSELFSVPPNESMSCGRRFWLPGGQLVDIVSLNSSLLQQLKEPKFQGQGFVGNDQLEEAAKGMKWSKDRSLPRAYRICMIHHHVVPILHREFPQPGYAASVVHDAGALIEWLADYEVDLVLHGHMHLPSVVKHTSPLDYPVLKEWHEVTIAALGSSGVTAEHRSEDSGNSYGILEFNRDGVKITVRNINKESHIRVPDVYSVVLPYNRPHA
jgi:predicted phosphodiesterase